MEELVNLQIELAAKIIALKDGSLIGAKEHILNTTELLIMKKKTKRVKLIIRKRAVK